MNVTGKTALVTGGGRGIGKGTCIVLAKNGANVVIADINLADANHVKSELTDMGCDSIALKVDVTNQQSVDEMIEATVGKYNRVDILVNNAGIIAAPGWEERDHYNDDDWNMIYDINIRGVSRVTESVAPVMKDQMYGKIINISSGAGRVGSAFNPPYNASKAAVISITQSMAMALAPFNINVNAVCPGLLWTPMWERIAYRRGSSQGLLSKMTPRQVFEKYVSETIPLGREQTPEDIGNVIAFLASEYAKNITGQSINVNGGSRMD